MKELLNIYNEDLNIIGTLQRSEIHTKGLLHQVVHCWVYEIRDNEKWIYLQQRSFNKANFSGCYDIAAAGHVDENEDSEAAVKREVLEELGINILDKSLHFLGTFREHSKFCDLDDNEFCQVYLYRIKIPEFEPGKK